MVIQIGILSTQIKKRNTNIYYLIKILILFCISSHKHITSNVRICTKWSCFIVRYADHILLSQDSNYLCLTARVSFYNIFLLQVSQKISVLKKKWSLSTVQFLGFVNTQCQQQHSANGMSPNEDILHLYHKKVLLSFLVLMNYCRH